MIFNKILNILFDQTFIDVLSNDVDVTRKNIPT